MLIGGLSGKSQTISIKPFFPCILPRTFSVIALRMLPKHMTHKKLTVARLMLLCNSPFMHILGENYDLI